MDDLESRVEDVEWDKFVEDVITNTKFFRGKSEILKNIEPCLNESHKMYLYNIWSIIRQSQVERRKLLLDEKTARKIGGYLPKFDGSPYIHSNFEFLDCGFYFFIKYLNESTKFDKESVDVNFQLFEKICRKKGIKKTFSIDIDKQMAEEIYIKKLGENINPDKLKILKELFINPFDKSLESIINILNDSNEENISTLDRILFEAQIFSKEAKKDLVELFAREKFSEELYEKFREFKKKSPKRGNLISGYGQYPKYVRALISDPKTPLKAIKEQTNFKHSDIELIKYIGGGANKNVYLARDKHFYEDKFAAKLFDLDDVRKYLEERNGVRLTEEELLKHEKRAAFLSRGNNKYLNRIRHIEKVGDKYIIIEDLFDMTLEDLIEKHGRIVYYEDAYSILRDILTGVDAFHKMGLCHGDLTAANIGIIWVVEDIGPNFSWDGIRSCRFADDEKIIRRLSLRLTDAGYATTFKYDDRSGTWYFGGLSTKAPELYSFKNEGVYPTEKSDLWSSGVLAYYITTGKYPFYNRGRKEKKIDFNAYERKVYDDIEWKLEDPEKRLFDREDFKPEGNGYVKVMKQFILNTLKIKPEERKNSFISEEE